MRVIRVRIQTKPRFFITRLGVLGDVILTTPIIRKIHEDHGKRYAKRL